MLKLILILIKLIYISIFNISLFNMSLKIKKNIDSFLLTEYFHIFYKEKELKQLTHKTLSGVEKAIKENVNSPKNDKKVYLIKLKYIPDSEKKILILSCCKYTITPKLLMVKKKDDDCFTIIYSQNEYKKYNFDISHIKKIINKIKKDELDVSVQFINISDILK